MIRRRILLTTDVVGGVWDFCLVLGGGLAAADCDVTLLALGSPSAEQRRTAADTGVALLDVPLKLEWMQDSAADVEATRTLVADVAREVRADVLHANQFAAACADVDVPTVLTLHSDVLSWRRWTYGTTDTPAEWRAYAGLVRQALACSDGVVAVSHFLANEVRSLYAFDRPVEVIHNGWPAPPVHLTEGREPITLAAGRVWDQAKNISLIADAAGEAISIKLLEQRHHDPARALEVLTQPAHRRRSIFGNEIDDRGFYAFEILPQQNHIGTDFNHFAGLS